MQFGINKHLQNNFFKDYKLHSPYGLMQFWSSLKKFTSAYLLVNCTMRLLIQKAITEGKTVQDNIIISLLHTLQ